MTRPSTPPRRLLAAGGRLAPDDVVFWNWPLRDEGLRSWGMLVGVAVLVSLVWTFWRDLALASAVALALLVALWRLWLPVKWELGLTGITQTAFGFKRRIAWLAIASYEIRPDGVWLFADREQSHLRAVFIGYAGRREEVVALVNYYLGTWAHSSESTQSLPH